MFLSGRLSACSWKFIYLGLIALFTLPLGGCGYVTAIMTANETPQYDATTGTGQALIADAGRQPFDPACRIMQNKGLYRAVVVDAGSVMLQAECSRVTGVFGHQTEQLGRANLAFHAESGRHYRIAFSEDFGFPHVVVTEAENSSRVVHRSLVDSRLPATAAAANVTLVSRSGPGVIPCKFGRPWADRRVSSVRRPAGSFLDEPYSHQVVVECSTYAYVTGDVKERYEAPIDFVPVSGRLYTVHMDEENPDFVFVTDVSADVQTVAYVRAVRTL